MIHCCIFYVLRQRAAVQGRADDVRVGDARRSGNHALATQRGRRPAREELVAADGSIADQEVPVGATGGELQWILILARDSRIDFLRVQVASGFSNERRRISVILKVNKAVVLERTLLDETFTCNLKVHRNFISIGKVCSNITSTNDEVFPGSVIKIQVKYQIIFVWR